MVMAQGPSVRAAGGYSNIGFFNICFSDLIEFPALVGREIARVG
jgi:hypothetical protein